MIIKLVLLGVLQITSYRPVSWQTKPECTSRNHCRTSIGDNVTQFGIAASQDLLKSGEVKYGDIVLVEGYGYRVINDCMGPRATRSFDLLVFTKNQEKAVGIRHLKVWLVERPESEIKQ
jgi:3D (Asp-Asp-Asp) domain-containing protein